MAHRIRITVLRKSTDEGALPAGVGELREPRTDSKRHDHGQPNP